MSVKAIKDNELKGELEANENVAIKFYADWCGSCRLISPKFKKMSDDEQFNNIEFIEINAEENPEARKWAGVKNLPFFAVVKNGEIVEADTTSKEEKIVEMLNLLHREN